ncbi:ribosome maturation factor RimM [Paenibacillus aquistagni]|uniref:Ribosome maturation factor RimM n=1 Tax=Paenibacillus aquistagni TaxID=1852522 RepID=A0A1X7IMA6_9BACL|nr:ribosome maturation factor RimM [Paenibacillus aquistagni]NMM51273.1 ribosome maturation factor RimM [Paenibacillus aquistagni]SMG15820.1 16S rRNA processing protein RimM [Paenibacillus aquistagni]
MDKSLFTVGVVVNTQGIRGEVKIVPHTDFAEERFAPKSKLVLVQESSNRMVPVTVEHSRLHKNMYVVKFKEFNNINEVEAFKTWLIKVSVEEREPLEEGEYYYSDIIGCMVVTEDGEELGPIKEILAPGANHVWVVKMPKGKDLLLPVIDPVILDVNVKEKRVTVHLMEGLME